MLTSHHVVIALRETTPPPLKLLALLFVRNSDFRIIMNIQDDSVLGHCSPATPLTVAVMLTRCSARFIRGIPFTRFHTYANYSQSRSPLHYNGDGGRCRDERTVRGEVSHRTDTEEDDSAVHVCRLAPVRAVVEIGGDMSACRVS